MAQWDAPTSVSVSATDHHTCHLTWNLGANGPSPHINIYRNSSLLKQVTGSDTSADDSTCSAGTLYTYYLVATGAPNTNSSNSTSDSATTPVNAPTSLNGTPSYTNIPLTWTNGESNYDNVYLEYKIGTGGWNALHTCGGSDTSYNATGLSEGTDYSFRARGKVGSTYSSYSSTYSDTTSLHPPTGMARTGISGTACGLSWTNGATYTTVRIWRSTDGVNYSQIDSISGSNHTYNDTTLTANQKYYWKIKGGTDYTTSAYSGVVSYTGWTGIINTSAATSADITCINVFGVTGTFAVYTASDISAIGDYHVTQSNTVTTGMTLQGSISTKANFAYYVGDEAGNVYTYSKAYLSDNGKSIVAYYRTKPLDFSDSNEEMINRFKTVYGVKVIYKDMTANMVLNLYVSNDGGVTWDVYTKTVGNGDLTTKSALFYFIKTGEYFDFKIESPGTATKAWILATEIRYSPAGQYYPIQ